MSVSSRIIRSLFRSAGFDITRIDKRSVQTESVWLDEFGGKKDAFLDIKRLSQAWNWDIKVFFDVGANDGATAKAAISHLPGARIYAFEPHPQTFAKLRDNISRPQLSLFNIALGDWTGEAELFSYENDKINSLSRKAPFAMRFGKEGEPIKVRIDTIDDFCASQDIAGIDVLKIDTEGSELVVLKGAGKKLANRDIRFVYTEFNDVFGRRDRDGGALFPICEYLYPFGFRFVAAYTDCLTTEGDFFAVHNALFAIPPA
jgi:FkbM family methyltransferase